MTITLTKQQKRQKISDKLKTKQKLGATFAGQIQHTRINQRHSGNKKITKAKI